MNTNFVVFGLTRSGIEPKSNVSVAELGQNGYHNTVHVNCKN